MNALTRHLMFDALRRGRSTWCFAGFFVLAAWTLVAVGIVGAQAGVATSLIAVVAVGPMTSLTSLLSREVRYLPVTSRDVWIAAWVLSTVVAAVYVTSLQLTGFLVGLAFGYPQPQAMQSLVFVPVCAFAYGGTLLPISPLIGYTSAAAAERQPKWFWATLATLTFVVYPGGLIGPWAAWSYLPTSFADLSVPAATISGLGLVAAFGALVWTPQRYGGIGRRAGLAAAPVAAHAAGRTAPPTGRPFDQITGLGRLLLPAMAWALGLAVAGAAGLAWYFATFEPSSSLYELFAASGLLIFSAAGLSPKVIMGTALFAPFLAIGSSPAWDGYTRHLRVLPMSAADTTRLLIATPVLLWAVVWVVLLGLHLLVIGLTPEALRPELFLYLSGLSALIESVSRHGKKPGRPFSLAAIPVFLLVGVAEGFSGRLDPVGMFRAHAVIGASAFLIATFLTYRSLTRSTSSAGLYRSTVPSLTAD